MLIDITRLVWRRASARLPTGVDRVGLACVVHWRRQARAVLVLRGRSLVLTPADSQAAFDWLLQSDAAGASPSAGAGAGAGANAFAAGWQLARWCWRAQWGRAAAGTVLLNVLHRGLEHAHYAQDLRRCGVRPVFFVHDLIPLLHPEYSSPGEPERHARRLRHALQLGQGLAVNSQATLRDLQAHAQQLGLPLPPTVVAPLAPFSPSSAGAPATPCIAALPRPLAAPYFVVLGTIEPRKNHLLLLHLWRQLVQRLGAAAPHLVVIGRRGWQCQETFNLLDRCTVIQPFVHELAHCGDAALAQWLQHAQALLFPSFTEGYGMPAVEALALGVPVIASDLGVLRESVADVPDYADALDGAHWLALINGHLSHDGPLRQAQLQRLQRFVVPGWHQHQQQMGSLLDQVRQTPVAAASLASAAATATTPGATCAIAP